MQSQFVLSSNLKTWMTNLPQKLKETPIIHLAIPGSHNSGSYAITGSSEVAPDADDTVKMFASIESMLNITSITQHFMAGWSITQTYSIIQQLRFGIRYFDLRIATKINTDQFFFVHTLYSAEVGQDFRNINDFLNQNPKEVVILDFQHFHQMDDNDHRRFKKLLESTFGQKLLPFSGDMAKVSLQSMTKLKHQVIVVYRRDANLEPAFWPAKSLPNPWANTDAVPTLIDFLNKGLKGRNNCVGFVSQSILTPDVNTVKQNWTSNLRTACFDPLADSQYRWLISQKPGPGGVNIVATDFVESADDKFTKAVIELNKKLLM